MRALAAGDDGALRALLMRHQTRVVAVARRMLGNDAEAEDVAQETFLRLWRHAGALEIGPGGIGGWLRRVSANLVLDRIRARRPQDPDALERMAVPAGQHRHMAERDLSRRVDRALQQLPERQRLALVLCHYEELAMAEAADIMGVSAEAVESLLARGRRALKAALAADWKGFLPDADGL